MYEQENVRNNEQPNYSRLKTIVRRHFAQTMRTRNFRARSEIVERGTVSGKQLDSVRKETQVVSVMIEHLENRCDQRQDGQVSSPAPKAQTQTDGKKPSKGSGLRGESPSGTRGRISCRHLRKCTNPSCNFWPYVSIANLNQDAHVAIYADSDTPRLLPSPLKSRRKVM